jgi:peptidoglycan/LPS O-acetylase OafA/YrhL
VRTAKSEVAKSFLPHIEGLRAVAVLLVMVYHAGSPFVAGGFIGVDVFFVISGFLITALLLRELDETGRVSFVKFYARRARRLLPTATVVLVVTAAAAWVILPPLRWSAVAYDTLAAALWSGNIRSAITQIDYLTANDDPSPLLHFWSLGVEEQFYLFWPALLSFGFAALWRWMSAKTAVATVSLLTIVGSFALSQHWTGSEQPYAFFLLPSRAWELAAGALLAALYPRLKQLHPIVRRCAGLLGLAAIAIASVNLDHDVRWPGTAAVVPVLATVAVIASGGAGLRVLTFRPMLAVGRWSYALYLWHWPPLVLAPVVIGRPLELHEAFLVLIGSSLVAVATYRLIENPIRSHRRLVVASWRSLALGTALVAVSSASAVALNVAPLPQAPVNAQTDSFRLSTQFGYEQLYTAAESVKYVPADLTPQLIDAEDDRFGTDLGPCFASNPGDQAPEKGCFFGDLRSERTIALIGDSHAAQWMAALLVIAEQEGFRLLVLTKSACPPVQLKRSSETLGSFPECWRWNTSVIERLQVEKPEVTLIAGYAGYAIEQGLDSYEHKLQAWISTFEQLQPYTKAILIADTPYPDLDVPVCLSANMADVASCVQDRRVMMNGGVGRSAEIDAARSRSIPVVETFDLICPTMQCPVIVGNTLVYRDESHITAQFAKWVSGEFAKKLIAQIPNFRTLPRSLS